MVAGFANEKYSLALSWKQCRHAAKLAASSRANQRKENTSNFNETRATGCNVVLIDFLGRYRPEMSCAL